MNIDRVNTTMSIPFILSYYIKFRTTFLFHCPYFQAYFPRNLHLTSLHVILYIGLLFEQQQNVSSYYASLMLFPFTVTFLRQLSNQLFLPMSFFLFRKRVSDSWYFDNINFASAKFFLLPQFFRRSSLIHEGHQADRLRS